MRRQNQPQAKYRIEFSVENDGKSYQCDRVISGVDRLTQVISVWGVGSKNDSAIYGSGHHPKSSMESAARIIAGEIIREHH